MNVITIRERVTSQQLSAMLECYGDFVKLAVDAKRGILAGGGELHADCEEVLLKGGSQQRDIWGADWNPETEEVTFDALINIRPGQGNFSREVQDDELRTRIAEIVHALLEVN